LREARLKFRVYGGGDVLARGVNLIKRQQIIEARMVKPSKDFPQVAF